MKQKPTDNQAVRVRNTPWFKLRKEQGRNFQAMNLKKQFGFTPEVIVIERMAGRNNVICVRAILTEVEAKKEDALKIGVKKDKD